MIAIGNYVLHLPSGKVRRISGVRGERLQFAQVVKRADGSTYYWAVKAECVRVYLPAV